MIEPRVLLALSMHAAPGVYALLLGSGISRAARIPTGWEVVEDLIGRVACASGEDCGSDPEAWYQDKYSIAPTYSGLLEAVGKSAAERSRILKGYFEPDEEELANGDKQPTQAHRAIARLVKRGVVRVILTTNFDRLMENALAGEGISPSVISTPEAVEGATPLAHSDCTLVKLHGDYLDLATKNAPLELSKYNPRMDALLDRVFDEYGLIVCGWSGEWDTALRNAIKRCKNRRFTLWWASMGKPAQAGQDIVDFCRAEVIPIEGADEFFEDLSERLSALDQLARPHPISTPIAVELTKKYLSEPKYRIKLHDLLMGEVEKIVRQVCSDKYPVTGSFQDEDYAQRVREFEVISETAMHIVATGAFWGEMDSGSDTWMAAINRLANSQEEVGQSPIISCLHRYPARLLLYAAGVGYAKKDRFADLHALLAGTVIRKSYKNKPLVMGPDEYEAFEHACATLACCADRRAPVSGHMQRVIRPVFARLVPDDSEFERAFDRFEALQSLHSAHTKEYAIPSAFMTRRFPEENATLKWLQAMDNASRAKTLLDAGFCDGVLQKLFDAVRLLTEMTSRTYHRTS